MPPVAIQREFCRRLFRAAAEDTAEARQSYLDGLADAALEAQASGTALVGTSVQGQSSAQFELFSNWTPADILALIDAARSWAAEDDVDDALALIGTPVRHTHFECGLER